MHAFHQNHQNGVIERNRVRIPCMPVIVYIKMGLFKGIGLGYHACLSLFTSNGVIERNTVRTPCMPSIAYTKMGLIKGIGLGFHA